MNERVLVAAADFRAAVDDRMGENDMAGAHSLAVRAIALYPNDLNCQLQLGRILEHGGRYADAISHYRAMYESRPNNHRVAARLAINLARQGQAEEALSLYNGVIADAPLTETQRTQIARQVARPLRRNLGAAALLAARAVATPDDASVLREAAKAAAATGNLSGALEFFAQSAAIEPLPVWARISQIDVRSKLARTSGQWPPVDARLEDALEKALLELPPNAALVRFLNRLPLTQGAWNRLYEIVRRSVDLQSNDGFLLYETMLAALQANDRLLADSLIVALPIGSEWEKRAAPLANALQGVSAKVWSRSRLNDDKAAELQIVRVPEAEATLLVFATLTGNFMMLPLAMIDALLADIPVNVIYLRDTTSYAPGLRGFRSFGLGVDDTIRRLKQGIAALGAGRLMTMGASASGLSAIRYGARLGAERVITFGALTSLGPEFGHTAIQSGRLTMAAVAEAQTRFRDVASELSAAAGMRVAFHYGADYKLDADHADRVKELPAVSVYPSPGVDHHYVVLSLIATGTFRDAVWAG